MNFGNMQAHLALLFIIKNVSISMAQTIEVERCLLFLLNNVWANGDTSVISLIYVL